MAPGGRSSQKRNKDAIAQRHAAAEEARAAAAEKARAAAAASAAAAAAAALPETAAAAAAAVAAKRATEVAAPATRRTVPATASVETAAAARTATPIPSLPDMASAEMAAPARRRTDIVPATASVETAATATRVGQLVPIPSLPDTGDMEAPSSSRGADASAGNVMNASTGPRLSIRCKNKNPPEIVDMDTGKKPDPAKRGIVTGTKTMFKKKENNNQPLVIEYSEEHRGPSTQENRSMMSKDIGSAVRTKVPMVKPKFLDLSSDQRQPFEDYLKDLYHLPDTEVGLWTYIDTTADKIYRDWKYDCHRHYEEVSKELPEEFVHRPEEWEWLTTYFESPEFKKLSAKNAANRNKAKEAGTAINHHSGTTPFSFRVAANLKKGSLAPLLQTVCDVYGPSQNAEPLVAGVKRRMEEMVATASEAGESEVTSTIPIEEQVAVIEKEMKAEGRPGTTHRGLGNAAKRPAKQRGGARVPRAIVEVASMQDKLEATQKEMVNMKAAYQQEMADMKAAYQREMADMKATMHQLLAAQSNQQQGDPVVVAASPNLPTKSSHAGNDGHAGNDDSDHDGDNDNDITSLD